MKKTKASSEHEKAIVVGIGLKSEDFVEIKLSLAELEELCGSAGAEIVGSVAQVLEKYNSATLLGRGKVEEIRQLVEETEASLVIVDHQLTGVQSRNLEEAFGVPVLDRAQLILDIFAQRASTHEGKLQVELAQLLDLMPRQVGAWLGSLSRQGGGIGTRGPGETALEVDRRRIRERVKHIKLKLEDVRRSRGQHRNLRKKTKVPSFALIGYTNAGKSTLINRLTSSEVLAKDQLFATLDPTTRKLHLPELGAAVITDTVGFIRKLPTHLIEAFKATLEESAEADVLLHVIDLSNPSMKQQMDTVEGLVKEFGWDDKPVIYVFNKADQSDYQQRFQISETPRAFVSALTGENMDQLKSFMAEACRDLNWLEVELFIPNGNDNLLFDLKRESKVKSIETASQGSICRVMLSPEKMKKWNSYRV
ncbi:MAG: GTPase HflX [Bdellovibrionales bacterium]|nr:GTPase HflX [Bdellovibrionales bacterium]